jgi:hypothetical protein
MAKVLLLLSCPRLIAIVRQADRVPGNSHKKLCCLVRDDAMLKEGWVRDRDRYQSDGRSVDSAASELTSGTVLRRWSFWNSTREIPGRVLQVIGQRGSSMRV